MVAYSSYSLHSSHYYTESDVPSCNNSRSIFGKRKKEKKEKNLVSIIIKIPFYIFIY